MNKGTLVIIALLQCLAWGDETDLLTSQSPYSGSGYSGTRVVRPDNAIIDEQPRPAAIAAQPAAGRQATEAAKQPMQTSPEAKTGSRSEQPAAAAANAASSPAATTPDSARSAPQQSRNQSSASSVPGFQSSFGAGVSSSGYLISFAKYPGPGAFLSGNFSMYYYTTDEILKQFSQETVARHSWNRQDTGAGYLKKTDLNQAGCSFSLQFNVFPLFNAFARLPLVINPFIGIGLDGNVLWGTEGFYSLKVDTMNVPHDTTVKKYSNTSENILLEGGYYIPVGVTVYPLQPLHIHFLSKLGVTVGYAMHHMWLLPLWDPESDKTVPKNIQTGDRHNWNEVFGKVEIAY